MEIISSGVVLQLCWDGAKLLSSLFAEDPKREHLKSLESSFVSARVTSEKGLRGTFL